MEINFLPNNNKDIFLNKNNFDTDYKFYDSISNEDLSAAFEKDSRRYSRYLGDDLIKETVL